MIRVLAVAVVAVAGLVAGGAQAQEPSAKCAMFHKLSDGRWTSKIKSKVGNPKTFITLEPGVAIDRNLTIVGINVSDTIDRLCGGQ